MSPRTLVGLAGRLQGRRTAALAASDALAWVLGLTVMAAMNYFARLTPVGDIWWAATMGTASGLAFVLIGRLPRVHQGRARLGSFEDILTVEMLGLVVGLAGVLLNAVAGLYRWNVAISGAMAAILLMLATRGFVRMLREYDEVATTRHGTGSRPIVVVGAGEASHQLIDALFRDPQAPWHPVAMLDDDPFKRHRRIRGLAVEGVTRDLARVARYHGATTVVVAIPSARQAALRDLAAIAAESDLQLKVLPATHDLLDPGRVAIRDVRDIDVADLLGRHEITTDVASIADYLAGKRVLVTGAGGSIGSELCRQIARFRPAELIMLDRDESALHAVQLSLESRALLDGDDTVLADLRDAGRITEIFLQRRPDVVFHAAALKHLPLLEKAPGEAVKSNVWGTLNVLVAAERAGVARFVNISTDKAADPSSVLGYSKRLAEGLTAEFARTAPGTYLSVRFGNVLGSRGSVLTAFAAQVAAGGPVTVTDPHVSRYFMTIQEAVELVVQAGAVGDEGEVLVLDMGEPVLIDAVARQLIAQAHSREPIEVVYTGLRPGEKLHEDLFGAGEVVLHRRHPKISHVVAPPLSTTAVLGLDPNAGADQVCAALRELCDRMRAVPSAPAVPQRRLVAS